MHKCNICDELFSTCRQRKNHRKNIHGKLQCLCRRKFVLEKEMEQHRVAMKKNAKYYRCPDCCLSFNTEESKQTHMRTFKHGCPTDIGGNETINQAKPKKRRSRNKNKHCEEGKQTHMRTFKHGCSTDIGDNETMNQAKPKKRRSRNKNKHCTGEHVCTSCGYRFVKQSSLLQHQQHKAHRNQSDDPRKSYFDNVYERSVKVDKEDMNASRSIVDTMMSRLVSHVREQPGGAIFSPNVIKAGSVPVNAKIGKADEFDTNIELNVTPAEIRHHGKLGYGYLDNGDRANMTIKGDIGVSAETKMIPSGFATARAEKGSVPDKLLHNNDIIPREVKQDLFNKMKTAKNELPLTDVDISKKAHGPALTMTIHPPKESGVKHDISVDVTPSLKSDVSVTEHGWPRPATKRAFGEELIHKVIQTGTHLVPKKDEFWSVSNSKAERTLLSSIDGGNGCRKKVYKLMKKHVQTSKSQSTDGLSEISSHILKTQVLWSSEKHSSKDYWHDRNRDICLIDTLKDMETALKKGHLPDFFNPSLNVLEGKDQSQLRTLAEHLRYERQSFESK